MIRDAVVAALTTFVAVMLLLGCATSTPVTLPDGQAAHLIECHGSDKSLGSCYKQAAATCPGGYVPLNVREGQSGRMPERYLLVRCSD